MTFKDVKKFIETAEVNSVGYHKLQTDYPANVVHIYSSKRECNILTCHNNPEDIDSIVIAKIYFDDDEVSMIPVMKGGADYDNRIIVPITTTCDIDDPNFVCHCSLAFGCYGRDRNPH